MFFVIENDPSHYLGNRSWLLCWLKQKRRKNERNIRLKEQIYIFFIMFFVIENDPSHYLGNRNWLLCWLKQKRSKSKQLSSLPPQLFVPYRKMWWRGVIYRDRNSILLDGFDSRYPPTPHYQSIEAIKKTCLSFISVESTQRTFFWQLSLQVQTLFPSTSNFQPEIIIK